MKTFRPSPEDYSQATHYWNLIKGLNDNVKKILADKLSEESEEGQPSAYTEAMLDKFFGAWVGEESPEEIMKSIKEGNIASEPIKL